MGLSSLCAVLAAKARAFLPDRRANTAMMFGLALVPILIATGAAIDYARGVMVRQRMSEALDAAALAVGNSPSKPTSCSSGGTACPQALSDTANNYFRQNYNGSPNGTCSTPDDVTISIVNQAVTLSTKCTLDLTVLGIPMLGIGTRTIGASSTVVWGQTKLWVALVLDNSGSMSQGDRNGSKMSALQDAITNSDYGLLKTLQAAAANPGDVEVGIVPFTRSVNAGIAYNGTGAVFIDWAEWESQPANAGTLSSNLGPGGNCPWSTGNQGYGCLNGSANNSGNASKIPSSGLICPGQDNGRVNKDHNARYYNGCWDSTPGGTLTTTTDVSTPTTQKQNCTQVGSGTITCTKSGNPSTGHSSTDTTTSTTTGYSGDSTNTSTRSYSDSNDGSKSCTGRRTQTCTWTRTITTTDVQETVTKTGTAPYGHVWKANDHSTWSGCVMDRQQKGFQTRFGSGQRAPSQWNYDETNTQPSNGGSPWDDSQFPAENPASCPAAPVVTLSDDWTNLASKVGDMKANGSTNQAIGVEHGWQLLTTGAPYATGALPGGTSKVLILFSDGLNTQNRWVGDGSTEGSPDDALIDARENAACTAAKADKVTIYAIFIHIGTNGNSTALQNCASDSTKYYDLTSSAQIKDAFADIAQKITNLHVSQ